MPEALEAAIREASPVSRDGLPPRWTASSPLWKARI
jgi:hypothetical protein